MKQRSFWPHMEQLQFGDVNTFRSTKCDVERAVKRVAFPLRSGRFISRHRKHNIPQHKRRKTGIVWKSWLWQRGTLLIMCVPPPPTHPQSMQRINVFTNNDQVLLHKVVYLNCWEYLERTEKRGQGDLMKRGL